MSTRRLLFVLSGVLVAACGDGGTSTTDMGGLADAALEDGSLPRPDAALDPDGGAPSDLDAGSDADVGAPADGSSAADAGSVIAWFDPAHVLDVSIEMDAIAWQSLREQGRDFQAMFSDPMCLAQPFDSPFGYLPGDVTVDGLAATNVGIRKKGFLGSLSSSKPSLKIKMNELVPGQLLDGQKRVTLNNSVQDPSFTRTCLAFSVFRRVGLPAPRCNFARVRVNGEDLGLYVHVEDVKKPFLRQHFASDEGALFEGTLTDFRPGWLDAFENKSDTPLPAHQAALESLAAAAARPLGELEAALSEVLDLDAFITQWATETLLGHWDGYTGNTNNFFAYQDPTTSLFHILPWGPDTILSRSPFLPLGSPSSVFANGILAHRLYQLPGVRARYLAELRRLLDLVSEQSLHDELDALELQLAPIVDDPESFTNELGAVHAFLSLHRANLEAEIAAAGMDWPLPLRGPPCFHDAGHFAVELSSTFGSYPATDPFATGTGTLTATMDGAMLDSAGLGSEVGFGLGPEDLGDVVLGGLVVYPNSYSLYVYVVIDPALVSPGAVIALDDINARGVVLRGISPVFDFQVQGFLVNGTVEILAGDTTQGSEFRARIDAELELRFRL